LADGTTRLPAKPMNQNYQSVFMNPHNSILKIIIVHEDLNTGIEAATILRRMAERLEAEFKIESGAWQMESAIWKFEMLRDPELRGQATREAAQADMIIFSLYDAELPASVRDWIENVLPMKDGGHSALVALLDRKNAASSETSPPEAYLRRLAGQYGLDYFCNTDNQNRRFASGIEPLVVHSKGDAAVWRTH